MFEFLWNLIHVQIAETEIWVWAGNLGMIMVVLIAAGGISWLIVGRKPDGTDYAEELEEKVDIPLSLASACGEDIWQETIGELPASAEIGGPKIRHRQKKLSAAMAKKKAKYRGRGGYPA